MATAKYEVSGEPRCTHHPNNHIDPNNRTKTDRSNHHHKYPHNRDNRSLSIEGTKCSGASNYLRVRASVGGLTSFRVHHVSQTSVKTHANANCKALNYKLRISSNYCLPINHWLNPGGFWFPMPASVATQPCLFHPKVVTAWSINRSSCQCTRPLQPLSLRPSCHCPGQSTVCVILQRPVYMQLCIRNPTLPSAKCSQFMGFWCHQQRFG